MTTARIVVTIEDHDALSEARAALYRAGNTDAWARLAPLANAVFDGICLSAIKGADAGEQPPYAIVGAREGRYAVLCRDEPGGAYRERCTYYDRPDAERAAASLNAGYR